MRLFAHKLFVPILVSALGLGGAAFAVTGTMTDDVPVASEEVVEPTPMPEGTETPDETTEPTEPPASDAPTDPPIVEEPAPTDPVVEDTATDAPKKERSTEGCPEGFTGNHGQYVSSTTDKPKSEAAHSECGKPIKSEKPEKTPKPAESDDGLDDEPEPTDEPDADDGDTEPEPTVDEGAGDEV